jgi:hypothetical protein
LRTAKTERIIVAVNPAARSCATELGDTIKFNALRPLLAAGAAFREDGLQMDPISFGIFAVD